MLELETLIRTIKLEQALGGSSRDNPEYHAYRGIVYSGNKIKIEFTRASRINSREEYLHPNLSFY